MKLHFGFMKGMKGLFKDKNNNNQQKTKKIGKIMHDQIVGMYKGDESEVNHNIITPNTNPIQYQSITKNRSVYKNKDIKYKNNKKRRERKGNLECKYQVRVMMNTVQRRTMMRVYQVY